MRDTTFAATIEDLTFPHYALAMLGFFYASFKIYLFANAAGYALPGSGSAWLPHLITLKSLIVISIVTTFILLKLMRWLKG